MRRSLEDIAQALRLTREQKGLSQRALSERSGLPQGQISKIENAAVDLRLTSLIELARALDLEVSLVPRTSLAAIDTIILSTHRKTRKYAISREWEKWLNAVRAKMAQNPTRKDYTQVYYHLRDLEHFLPYIEENKTQAGNTLILKKFLQEMERETETKKFVEFLRDWRNTMAHEHIEADELDEVRPAYSLSEDEND